MDEKIYEINLKKAMKYDPLVKSSLKNKFSKSEKVLKLLQTSGLVRKKVLVRKKGSKPFWSTRWVQEGEDVKEVVRALGFEVVEEEKKDKKREPTGRVHLQGWMDSSSITANEVRIGDVRLFNRGEDTIINIEQKTPKTLIFTYAKKDHEGKNYTQNVRNTTKIVIKELYDDELKKELKKERERRKKQLDEQKKKVVTVKPKPKPEVTVKRSLNDIKNEIIRRQNKIYYAKNRGELDIIPGLEEEIKVLEKEVKEIEDKPRELIDVKSDFIPAKTMEEANERINKFITPVSEENKLQFIKYGVNLNGLKLKNVNSILNGFEKSMGKHGITLTFIGWNERKQRPLAQYNTFASRAAILFQKTATKNVEKTHKKAQNQFEANKIDAINKFNRYLTYKEMRPGDHDRTRDKIAKMEVCERYSVDSSTNDPLALIASHEGQHAIYFKYKLESKWKDNLTLLVGDDMHNNIKCASVSEYGMSSPTELFAEVGAAISFGIEIDPDVKQAYLKTIGSIR